MSQTLVLMQTQSRDGYVFVVLLFIHVNVSVLTFLSGEMIFLRCKAIFLSSYEILEHKGHWNATVCAGFLWQTEKNCGSCYQTQINDQEICHKQVGFDFCELKRSRWQWKHSDTRWPVKLKFTTQARWKPKERQENVFLALRLLCCYLISLKAVLQRSQNTRESLVEFNESCAFKELANLHLFSSFWFFFAENSVETGNYNKNCS